MTIEADPEAIEHPEHKLERIDSDPNTEKARYRCSCGAIGAWLAAIVGVVTPTERAKAVHRWHVSLAAHPAPWRDK